MSHIDELREVFNSLQQELANEEVNVVGKVFNRKLEEVKQKAIRDVERENNVVGTEAGNEIKLALGQLAIIFSRIFILGGIVTLLLIFPIAEYTAVHSGIVAFEDSKLVSILTSLGIVLGYIVVTFILFMLQDNLEVIPKSSLDHYKKGIQYFFTGNTDYLIEIKPIEMLYSIAKSGVRFAEIAIILFGFIGRVYHLAEKNSNVHWYNFFIDLGLNANVTIFFGIVGTIIAILTLLRITKLSLLFVYSVFIENAGKINLGKSLNLKALAEERILEYQIEMVQQILAQKRANKE